MHVRYVERILTPRIVCFVFLSIFLVFYIRHGAMGWGAYANRSLLGVSVNRVHLWQAPVSS